MSVFGLHAAAITVAGTILFGGVAAARADQSDLVPNTNSHAPVLTFDWPAIEVGIGSYEDGPTGLTVVKFPKRATVVVDSRGGAPGTVNTDALRLGYSRPSADAIVFSGGSTYGEEAITAVATGLKDAGVRSGYWGNIAFVPGAIIYDFGGRRLNEIYPDKRLAQAALQATRPGVFPLGPQGAGRMAMQGGFFGCNAHSGQGGAFRQIDSVKIAAFVVVNSSGVVTDRDGRLASCNRAGSWGNLTKMSELLQHVPASLKPDWVAPAAPVEESSGTRNTTISLIVTNQKLDYAGLQRLAVQVHTSMARGIQPFSTQADGDTLFAASTQEVDGKEVSLDVLATLGGEVMWDSVLASVPNEGAFVPPASNPTVSADALAAYAGTYEFAAAPAQAAAAFSGLGLEVALQNGFPTVVSPVRGGPAATAGVLAGDIVTELDGSPSQGLPLDQVLGKMRGPTSSKVELTISRKNHDGPVHVSVVRGPILVRSLLSVRAQGNALTVEAVGGRQVFEFQSAKPTTVTPLSDTQFFVAGRYHTRIAFSRDAEGKVSGAVLNPGRWAQKGVKVQ